MRIVKKYEKDIRCFFTIHFLKFWEKVKFRLTKTNGIRY